jgi:hypothetical protein
MKDFAQIFAWCLPEPNSGCWLWTHSLTKDGYGRLNLGHKETVAHKGMYEIVKGPVPSGLELDHLCRTRACINPDHLEPVTEKENCRRSTSLASRRSRQTECLRGHPFDSANTYRTKRGWRQCRACHVAKHIRLRAMKKANPHEAKR